VVCSGGEGRAGRGYARRVSALPNSVSEAEYLAAEELSQERAEYVDGYVRAMSGGTAKHSQIGMQIAVSLWNATRMTSCRVHTHDMKLRIETAFRTRYYYPDVMVACESLDDERWETAPCLIVEVLSPSTARFDAMEKLTAYCGIDALKAYVMVDGDGDRVVVHRRVGATWSVENYEPGDVLTLECPVIAVDVAEWLAAPTAPPQ
jgi:Uma2 family endonuclease